MPPQIIISLPVHTAVCNSLWAGVLAVTVQLSVLGLYLPPVFKWPSSKLSRPHAIISLPVPTAVCATRPSGALVVVVGIQVSGPGLYAPPAFTSEKLSSCPPH